MNSLNEEVEILRRKRERDKKEQKLQSNLREKREKGIAEKCKK